MWDFTGRIVDCEREYQTLNENLRGLITFHHFVSYKNPSWSKDKVTHWIEIIEEKRDKESIWREAQSNPTSIRSRQRCYSCKVPWEPDHRCRAKSPDTGTRDTEDTEIRVCDTGTTTPGNRTRRTRYIYILKYILIYI